MFFVYVLRSLKDGKHYIGYTQNITLRLQQHNLGLTESIKNRGPFEVVYKEVFAEKSLAIKREHKLKGYKGGNAFKKLISGPIV